MDRFLSKFVLFVLITANSLFVHQAVAATSTLLILGDSLSAGYQMRPEQAWPSLLSEQLDEQSINTRVINASISGDTTGNGLAQLESLLVLHKPNYVLIELGANDGLRGFPPQLIKRNLSALIEQSQAAGATVVLMQIRIPPNYGKKYNQLFTELYPTLANQYQVALIPFFLEHVIVKPEWMMDDGLHPKSIAQPWIAQYVAKQLVPLIKTTS